MPKTLVTGGAGFIGSHVVRALADRGDDLRLTMRDSSKEENLQGLEYESVKCDLLDRRQVRRALRDVERVFHCAGMTSLRSSDAERLFEVNVVATRTLLEECLKAGVERVVYTSSVAAIGPAPAGGRADENQLFTAGKLGIPYVNSKHEAEVEALRLAAQGLPVTIVNPSFVLGPDATRGSSMELVRRFIQKRIPAYVDGGLNIVDVRDVANAHLLAEKKGKVGRRYILSGRNFTLDRLFADLARISGVDSPRVKLPGPVLHRALALGERLPLPVAMPTSPDEALSASLWWCYRNTRAKSELGFKPRPHEETLQDAVNWQRAQIAKGRS
jgi:dihydroflavonol-4-reductase